MIDLLTSIAYAACAILLASCGSEATKHDSTKSAHPVTASATKQQEGSGGFGRFHAADDNPWSFGKALEGRERQAAKGVVERYYHYAAADDGARACGLLSHSLEESVVEDWGEGGGASYLRGKTCAAVMEKVFRHVPGQSLASLAAVEVTGVRVQGDSGFALLHSPAMAHGEVAIKRYGRRWRLITLMGREALGTYPQTGT